MTKIKDFFKHIGKKFKENWRKILLWSVLLVFAVCGMVYSWTRKNKGEIVSGSADTLNFRFVGSPVLSTFSQEFFYNVPDDPSSSGVRYVSNLGTFQFVIVSNTLSSVFISCNFVGNGGERALFTDDIFYFGNQNDYYLELAPVIYNGTLYTGYTRILVQSIGSTFNGDIVRVEFGNVFYSENYFYNTISYFDTGNNSIRFLIQNIVGPIADSNGDNMTLEAVNYRYLFAERVYYLISSEISNSEIYQNGYEDGLQEGIKNKDNAVNEAYTNGKNAGYNLAMETLNNNGAPTFLSLIDAVGYGVTKPFVSLLNFDLLGVNMLDFATSILTIFIVVKIITLFV